MPHSGPLAGIRIVELAGIGPAPHCCMLLSDMGAEVIRIDRPGGNPVGGTDRNAVLNRGRKSVAFDLKQPTATAAVLRLVEQADGLVEGFRPGVMERLGLGPETCLERNPKLVYGRVTGWGQDGPLARVAGHDINYIALAGALGAIGDAERGPVPPLNLVGDFGGGGMMMAFGMACGLIEAARSGSGQVIDAAMLDGSALLMAGIFQSRASGLWNHPRGENWLDGGAPFYAPYRCADDRWICIGSIEPQFYRLLCELLELSGPLWSRQWDREAWPEQKRQLTAVFARRTRAEWTRLLGTRDICFAPVMDIEEVAEHPHTRERGVFVESDGWLQPAPAPRFERTPGRIQSPPPRPGEHNDDVLSRWGFDDGEIARLRTEEALVDGTGS